MHALLVDCFLLGLLHGILPDEHTWPITFSYAIGSGSGRQGVRAAVYFAAAFTVQRMAISELSYVALAPLLRNPVVNDAVYVVVGVVMSLAGWILLRRQRCGHVHLIGHHHESLTEMERSPSVLTRHHAERPESPPLPLRWTLIHGFIAGFGLGGFALFVNGVAAPAMPNAWLGFAPGLLYGAGTTVTLAVVGAASAFGLRVFAKLNESDARFFGARAGARMLFAGGILFAAAGIAMAAGAGRHLPATAGYLVMFLFVVAIAIPALVRTWRELAPRQQTPLAMDRLL